jgi:tetratricopeptide (TPR) repeat protein
MFAPICRFRSLNPLLVVLVATCFLVVSTDRYQQADAKGHGKNTVEPSQENFEEGMRRFKDKDYNGAIDAFLQAIYFARNGYCPDGYFWLGRSYYEKGGQDQKGAVALNKCVEQTLKIMPDAHYYLALLYVRLQRLDDAQSEANLCLSQSSTKQERAKAWHLLGKVSEAQGNFDAAAGYYVDALGDPPWKYTEAWVDYGEVLMKQKAFEQAFEQFGKLLESPVALKNVPFDRVYNDVGLCMFIKGNHQGALDNWHKSLEYNRDNAAVHLQIALCFDKERHISSAIQEYKEYVRLSDDQKSAAQIKSRIALLEQRLNPVPLPEKRRPPPPEPIMTPQQIEAEKRQIEKEKDTLNPITPQRGDSGF